MNQSTGISDQRIDGLYIKLKEEAQSAGYNLNPDEEFAKELAESLLINEQRYGYWACPCRLAAGNKEDDLDIICPCDYRDADLDEYDACYCGLYVSQKIVNGKKKVSSIPERRLPAEKRIKECKRSSLTGNSIAVSLPVYRCKVCGYLCARDVPPQICPICKAQKERFERFI
ncbi:ferredoxin-thioredoxin reductase catalytic domain-containing protein [Elusimicrobiota bacterium]